MRFIVVALALFIGTEAFAQQGPSDPQFCQDAASSIADQRNQAFNVAANIQAQLLAAQRQVAALQKQVTDLKAKASPDKVEPDKKGDQP